MKCVNTGKECDCDKTIGKVDCLGLTDSCVSMPHFLALMDGLEIPNPEWYLHQPPEILKKVGTAIANQAKNAT